MLKNEYNVIGVMSGTSLDGIDLAYVTFNYNEKWTFKINVTETISYSEKWVSRLKKLVTLSAGELKKTDKNYTKYLAKVIKQFLLKNNIKIIDAVCSHGHTALHQPENKLTYQIGNLPKLAHILQQTVVCDYRVQDVAFGGQGAPLVPIGDALLFSEYSYCLNLGGFANISTTYNKKRIAFDICPVNIVLNKYVSRIGLQYDNKGKIASTGIVNKQLLQQLNALEFYKKKHPKSLGLEWVDHNIFPLIDSFKLKLEDVLCTFIEHIAMQITLVCNSKQNAVILVTGGGIFNTFLLSRIQELCTNKIVIPSKEIVEFKEALIFGFLGVLKLRGENNCLASVTGAKKDHSSGHVFC